MSCRTPVDAEETDHHAVVPATRCGGGLAVRLRDGDADSADTCSTSSGSSEASGEAGGVLAPVSAPSMRHVSVEKSSEVHIGGMHINVAPGASFNLALPAGGAGPEGAGEYLPPGLLPATDPNQHHPDEPAAVGGRLTNVLPSRRGLHLADEPPAAGQLPNVPPPRRGQNLADVLRTAVQGERPPAVPPDDSQVQQFPEASVDAVQPLLPSQMSKKKAIFLCVLLMFGVFMIAVSQALGFSRTDLQTTTAATTFSSPSAAPTTVPTPPPFPISRADWGARPPFEDIAPIEELPVQLVMAYPIQRTCHTTDQCANLTKELQTYDMFQRRQRLPDIAFNFVLCGEELVFEGRGWYNEGGCNDNKLLGGGLHVGVVDYIDSWSYRAGFVKLMDQGRRLGFIRDPDYRIASSEECGYD